MKKFIILSLLVHCLMSFDAIAQDVIFKRDGEEVKAKVIKVGKAEILYKNFEDPEFSNTSVKVQDVKKIRFEDGTEKIFKQLVPNYIGLSFGKSFAVGDFSSNNDDNGAGYAKAGSQLTLDAGFYIIKNLGLSASFGLYSNKLNTESLTAPYRGINNITFNFDKHEQWTGKHFFIGPLYSFRIGNRAAIDLKVMAGLLSLKKPSWGYHYRDVNGMDFDQHHQKGKGTSFGINIGTAFRYNFSKRLGMKLTWDFAKGEPHIHYKTTIHEPIKGTREEHNTIIQKVEIVKVGLGLLYILNR